MTSKPLQIVDYDPKWPGDFERLKTLLSEALGPLALAIEHVGSTAVPGLAAKPVIDLDVVIAGRRQLTEVASRLAGLGYAHEGDLGVPDREAFRPPAGEVPHHPYVCLQGSLALRNHLTLRDYLRGHSEAAQAYGRLKRDLAMQTTSGAEYGRNKTAFILGALRAAGFSNAEIHAVEKFAR